MDDLSVKVLRAYDIKGAGIIKEKGAYRIQLKAESRLIRKTNQTAKKIQFQHEIKENLYESGFENIDRFYFSSQNKPYFQLDEDIYTMTDLINYPEACFSNNREFISILECMSKMHKLLNQKGYRHFNEFTGEESATSEYEKVLVKIKKIKASLNIEKRLSDIDVMFLKNYNYYIDRIEQTISRLKKTKFEEYLKKSKAEGFVRHNNLKEENIFVNETSVYITNFSESAVGYYLYDLDNVIRRYMKRLPADCLPVSKIVEIYDKHNSLNDDELDILYALLIYPQKFVKVSSQYYSKKHAFIPGSIYARMQAEIENREPHERYLSEISNI